MGTMTTSEFDPLFIKGLRLLHSKSKDSTEQLKQLLDEVIAQSKQSNSKDRVYTSVKLEGESKLHIKKAPRETVESSALSKYAAEDIRERKPEKRLSEKNKQDSFESDAKIPKLEPPQVYSYYPSSPDLPKLDQYVTKKEDTDSSDDNAEASDFTMELMEMGIACVICNQIEVTQGNQLIECQECHNLYHQECHRPPATDYDVNDPRRVWYCAKCVKNMKKMTTKTQKTTKTSVAVPTKEPISQTKTTKSESSPPALILPFKRTELKAPISQGSSQTTANKPIGLAGLAANFGGRTSTAASSVSTATSARGTKTSSAAAGLNLKTFSSAAASKSSTAPASSNLTKTSTSTTFQNLTLGTTSSSASTISQKSSTSASATKGLGLLSAAVASSSRAAASTTSGNGNNSHKVTSCSPLMNADKRLQIMKKKASKMQERRRLSTK